MFKHFGKSPANEFNGKVCWITGASSGIGEALAKNLALCNARLVISARRKDQLVRVKEECLALNAKLEDKDILVLDFDMLDYSVHDSSFQKVLKHFGKLDLLISNAGRSQRARWQNIEIEVDRNMFDLNVFSLINLNRIAVRYFFKSKNAGGLAITSSIAGVIGAPVCGSYTGAKHALHGYFESLRNETRDRNLAITMLCPGPVVSDIVKESFTSKLGEKVDDVYSSKERRMTANRCAHLCLVAIANKLEESWQALFPMIISTYFLRSPCLC
ncbi:Dehydrogenase/reductase SDR family member 7 [Pseudolycoriella hygida]|uniref:Dehydrogenase/reductase SDR family member 7 n=1 Tax=Pseudolycoriella hygida TaxID=35572 RepID=A0A9Q0NHP1_9DIPT|nr:Dehydrogenase/reductase SDR family member 7 [Pseudolycoriella hygida]